MIEFTRRNLAVITLVQAITLFFVVVGLVFVLVNGSDTDRVVNALSVSQVRTAALAEQNAAIYNNIFAKFFAEENFICEELVAHNKVLGGPVPPPGICDVTLPH